jgi:hypothetical protein
MKRYKVIIEFTKSSKCPAFSTEVNSTDETHAKLSAIQLARRCGLDAPIKCNPRAYEVNVVNN